LIFYLDTSVLVAALTREARTEDIQIWLSRQGPEALAISAWVVTEFSAALSVKLRSKQIGAPHRARALAAFAELSSESLSLLPISASQFHVAARLADQSALGLRAGDALHLAIALEHRAMLVTLDRPLADAGSAAGIATRML
jgi:predicted nucleic acid-binding protein